MSGGHGDERDGESSRPNPIDVYVGQRIRQRRNALGISQEQVAAALGVSFQQVQKYERGLNRVGASRLYDLSCALDVGIGWFFDETAADFALPAGGGRAAREVQRDLDDDLLSRRETFDLARAFSGIADDVVRRQVLELVRSLGPGPAA